MWEDTGGTPAPVPPPHGCSPSLRCPPWGAHVGPRSPGLARAGGAGAAAVGPGTSDRFYGFSGGTAWQEAEQQHRPHRAPPPPRRPPCPPPHPKPAPMGGCGSGPTGGNCRGGHALEVLWETVPCWTPPLGLIPAWGDRAQRTPMEDAGGCHVLRGRRVGMLVGASPMHGCWGDGALWDPLKRCWGAVPFGTHTLGFWGCPSPCPRPLGHSQVRARAPR